MSVIIKTVPYMKIIKYKKLSIGSVNVFSNIVLITKRRIIEKQQRKPSAIKKFSKND